jgi:hypothetical protein
LTVDARAGAVERNAQSIDCDDDGDRDAGGDQAVFNARCAGLVLKKTREQSVDAITRLGFSRLQPAS